MPMFVDDFVAQLTVSGLLTADEVNAFRERLPEDRRQGDAQEFAREMVRQKLLTAYQATAAYQGKATSLFLGKYLVLDKLGQGGMGMVFKARHRTMNRIVAVKVLPSAATKSPENVQRFQREVQAAARLTHPNIVAAYDAGEANKTHFLVMEFVDGRDLSQVVKKQGPLPVEKAVECILQAANGLMAAHLSGIVHRDIKPANLLLDQEGTVKILDMGLARLDDGDANSGMTQTGTIMGTVDYMSPEQAMNTKSADARADIYSLGCSLYFLLAGKAPYHGESLMERLMAHREQPTPKLGDACPDVTPALENVYTKMMAKSPAERYQTMAEVVRDLQTCLTVAPLGATVGLDELAVAAEENSAMLSFLKQGAVADSGSSSSVKAAGSDPQLKAASASGTLGRTPSSETIRRQASPATAAESAPAAASGMRRMPLIVGGSVAAIVVITIGVWFSRGKPKAESETTSSVSKPSVAKTTETPKVTKSSTTIAATPKVALPAVPVHLEDLLEMDVLCYPRNGLFKRGLDHTNVAMQWRGQPIAHSIYLHPAGKERVGRATYRLDKFFASFRTTVGVVTRPASPQVFRIFCDGLLRWESPALQQIDDGRDIEVDLRGVTELRLEVESKGDTGWAHTVWIEPKLTPLAPGIPVPEVTPAYTRGTNDPPISEIFTSPEWTWTEPVELGPPFAGEPGESGVSLIPDERLAAITSRTLVGPTNTAKETFLLMRNSRSGLWGNPINVGAHVNYPAGAYTPKLSPDGLELYFRSTRTGTLGGMDFWVARRPSPLFSFGKPENLGPNINSPAEETNLAISPDGLTLVFQSNRETDPPTTYRLWISTRSALTEPFVKAVLLDSQVTIGGRFSTDATFLPDGLGIIFLTAPDGQRRRYRLATRPNPKSPFDKVVPLEIPWDDGRQMLPNSVLADGRTLLFSWARGTQTLRTLWSATRVRKSELLATPTDLLASSKWEWTPPENFGPQVNSPLSEQGAAISKSGLILLFASEREDKGRFDIFESRRTALNETFGPPVKLPAPVNSRQNERDPLLSPDGLMLIISSSNSSGGNGKYVGGADLISFTRKDVNAPWGNMTYLDTVNSPGNEQGATLSPDRLTLLFQSDRDGGAGSFDLWVARRKSPTAPFEAPVNLGSRINTTYREEHPSFFADGNKFVFCRNGDRNAMNLYVGDLSRIDLEAPTLLEFPDDSSTRTSRYPTVAADGQTILFASTRKDGQGDFDLWATRRTPVTNSGAATLALAFAPRDVPSVAVPPPAIVPSTATAPASSAAQRGPSPYEVLTSPDWSWTAPENLGDPVNTSGTEDSPSISGDGLILVFHSGRTGGQGQFDLWQATRSSPDAAFSPPVNLTTVNSRDLDADPHLSSDGRLLLFSSNRPGSQGQDLWMSTRSTTAESWSQPQNLGSPPNQASTEWGPTLSDDELTLIFHGGRPGSLGGDDLWMSRRASTKEPFGNVVNMGPRVNSAANEGGATLSSDGLVLLFHRRDAMSQSADLWMATRPNAGAPFGDAALLPAPIKSSAVDQQPALSPDGHTLYFVSNRTGGKGNQDIWFVRRVKK